MHVDSAHISAALYRNLAPVTRGRPLSPVPYPRECSSCDMVDEHSVEIGIGGRGILIVLVALIRARVRVAVTTLVHGDVEGALA